MRLIALCQLEIHINISFHQVFRNLKSCVIFVLISLHTSVLGRATSKLSDTNVLRTLSNTDVMIEGKQSTIRRPLRKISTLTENDDIILTRENNGRATHVRQSHVQSRIINGKNAPKGRYPYIVSLTTQKGHECGGTLIAPDIVLSAAHCKVISFDTVLIGRHNFDDDSEIYETFVVEKTSIHPKYESESSDSMLNYDFMMIKLYGQSRYPVVKINGNPNIPGSSGDTVHVMGWGVMNLQTKALASVLQEVEVQYIPNDQCNQVEGYFSIDGIEQKISLSGKITETMMCAKGTNEDACQGDSGGPLIIAGKSAYGLDDLLIGVVSWGIGCAHESFPGVYARISNQIGWINRFVCDYSEKPPENLVKYSCPARATKNIVNGPQQLVTVVINLDKYPQETGWLLRSVTSDETTTHIFAPIGVYRGREMGVIVQEVLLYVEYDYEFIMLDAYGDGLQYNDANYYVYRGSRQSDQILVQGKGSEFSHSITHRFNFPEIATKSPTRLPAIFRMPTMSPTSKPTMKRPLLILKFKLDKFPEEISWLVKSTQSHFVLGMKPYGSYDGYEHGSITEEMYLYGPEYGNQQYTFTIHDNGGNGLCCDNGPGSYQVYLDEVSDASYLFSGGVFSFEEQYSFVLEWPPTTSPTMVPSLQNSLLFKESSNYLYEPQPPEREKINFDFLRPTSTTPPVDSNSTTLQSNDRNNTGILFNRTSLSEIQMLSGYFIGVMCLAYLSISH